ncbi:phenylacetate--CoA ligase family protein [Paenibacillus sp. NEAU-GSW1]|uniref:phenylacetate--CoA ligase family protein n=1 Tax=Paenibacillus sp. NEAU-GSW1 TaxID=2682486 RepID=UPI0012E228AC|nr:AMP-binding protein [Paenibacillus sp. NEAU-GSW1]MUT64890.1 AMP-binding protein [Paenibacillus sp. NEAU-GSW1]
MIGVEALSRYEHISSWFKELDANGESIETLDRVKVNAYHQYAIHALLSYVWDSNNFYRDRLKADGYDGQQLSLDEFQNISFMNKDTLKEHFKEILTKKPLAQISKSTGTSGGKPTYIGHTLDELYNYYFLPKYPTLMEKAKHSIVANALPYEMSSSALTFHHEFSQLLGCTILPVGKGGAYSEPELALQFMQDWNADILVTTPSYAVELYEAASSLGISTETDIKLRHIYLTGEGSSNHFRNRIEQLWNCSSTILYGSLEAMLIGLECEEKDGFHIADGHLYIEIIDPETGARLENGQQGELVVTTLLREGMPLIRYRTGDIAFIDESECACGISLPKLHLRGRTEDQLQLSGQRYSPFYLENLIMQEPEMGNSYRFVITNDHVKLEVEPRSKDTDRTMLQRSLQSLLEFHINEEIEIEVVDKVLKNKGKMKRVVYNS